VDLELKNKVVLVTGGAKGIGAAIVKAAAAEGAIPVIVDRDVEAGNQLHRQIPASDLIVAELAVAEGCYSAIQKVVEKHGRLDALVNNAGVNVSARAGHVTGQHIFVDGGYVPFAIAETGGLLALLGLK
jgi:NAD(P)-dependent dehydrogenase (short-subunit alcohol dehydrogenase family)